MTISIDSLEPILAEGSSVQLVTKNNQFADTNFSDMVNNLNNEVVEGQSAITSAMKGDKEMMHRAILEINEAQSMLQLSVSIRDKVIEGYKEIMRMDV